MQHKLGTHWIKTHGRPEDLKFIRDLQPPSVKLVAGDVPDPQWISDVYSAAPNTLIVLRSWAMSEQKSDMAADPAGTGKRHAREWSGHIERLRTEAKRRNLPFPATEQLVVLGINEPEVWTHLQQTVDYTVAFLDACKKLALTAGALNLSVGWPANTGKDTPPDWTPFEPVHAALIRGRHYLFLHEYHDLAGPSEMWGWWCGRYERCPWPDVRIIIGEYGIDRFVKDASGDPMRRGWQGWISAEQYMTQIAEYHEALLRDKRIHSVQPFSVDYGSQDWRSFDLPDLYPQLLAHAAEVRSRPQAQAVTLYVIAQVGVNLRSGAGTEHPILHAIPYGDAVGFVAQTGEWAQVTHNGATGYAYAQFLGKDKPKGNVYVPVVITPSTDERSATIKALAAEYGVDERVALAVLKIESGGSGFRDGKLLMRFEPHVFKARLLQLFDEHFKMGDPAWDGKQHFYANGGKWQPFHGNQEMERAAQDAALALAEQAAYESASYGAGQIMGFNHAACGYASAEDMAQAFALSEAAQLRAMFQYWRASGALRFLQSGDYVGFAAIYNGPGQADYYANLIRQALGV